MPTDLLPPSSTPLERAIADTAARLGDVPVPIDSLWDPATCRPDILPWLAWALSVDNWDSTWSSTTKRAAVAESIEIHRTKGTPASVEAVLQRFDELLTIEEWHEQTPHGEPHTFEVTLPLVTETGVARGGRRSSAAFAEQIIAEITRVKPLREHLTLLQSIAARGGIGVQGVARAFAFSREPMLVTVDESQPWTRLLQDEDGEPLQDNAGGFLDETP